MTGTPELYSLSIRILNPVRLCFRHVMCLPALSVSTFKFSYTFISGEYIFKYNYNLPLPLEDFTFTLFGIGLNWFSKMHFEENYNYCHSCTSSRTLTPEIRLHNQTKILKLRFQLNVNYTFDFLADTCMNDVPLLYW